MPLTASIGVVKARLSELNELIRAGKSARARALISSMRTDRLGRAERLEVARIARRSGLVDLSVRLLNPLVRNEKTSASASTAEKAEYAMGLSKIGATSEALDLITSLPHDRNPEVLLFHAFILISRWEYGKAIPLLKRHGAQVADDDYNHWVGRVNLAAALTFEGA